MTWSESVQGQGWPAGETSALSSQEGIACERFLCCVPRGLGGERLGGLGQGAPPTSQGFASCRNSGATVSRRLKTFLSERKGLLQCEMSLRGSYLCIFTLQPLNCAPAIVPNVPISKALD